LVSLHKAADENGDVDALTDDEVTIIGAVLDLRAKPVSKIMTPIADCFTLPTDAILDEKVMDQVEYWFRNSLMVFFFYDINALYRLFRLVIRVYLCIHLAAKPTLLE
jgi:hypothetical protein